MAAPANPKEEGEEKEEEDSSSPSSSSRPFASAVAAIAVAQICGGAGFTAAEPFALRALSDVAALYIEALARSAAAHARGRTDSNLLDLVCALEELEAAACGGSLGGSDPARLLLRSSVLTELMAFVRDVDEVPFAKPIRRRAGRGGERQRAPPSFVETGKEPPMPHVPRWLPCFPESWEGWGRGEKEVVAKEEKEEAVAVAVAVGMDGEVKREESGVAGVLPEERARVRFRIGASCDPRRRGR